MKTAIVTDTNSGIFGEEAVRLGINVIPMPIIIDGETFYEKKNITEEEFYEALSSGRDVSTSQPAPGDLMELWDKVLEENDQLVHITMSGAMSNSFSTAYALADEYDGRVQVVDSRRVSVPYKELVLTGKRLADEGKNAVEIKDFLDREATNCITYVTVNTLEYLKKGGRIKPAAAMIGNVLKIRPVLKIDGDKLDSHAKVRGPMKKCVSIMLEAIKHDVATRFADTPVEKLKFGAAGSYLTKEEEEYLLSVIQNEFPNSVAVYDPLGLSMGAHLGPKVMGLAVTVW